MSTTSHTPTPFGAGQETAVEKGMQPAVRGDALTNLDPFSPRGTTFTPVSFALSRGRTLVNLCFMVPLLVGMVAAALLVKDSLLQILLGLGAAAVVVEIIWLLWLVPRQVRAKGWALSEEELMVRGGIMFKKLTVVPLGRVQYVDISEGPVARSLGYAEVKIHTASATTDASIPGVPRDVAAKLRESISALAQSQMEGM